MVSLGPPPHPAGSTPLSLLFSNPRIFARFWRVSAWAWTVEAMASQSSKHRPRRMGGIVSKRTVDWKYYRRRRSEHLVGGGLRLSSKQFRGTQTRPGFTDVMISIWADAGAWGEARA